MNAKDKTFTLGVTNRITRDRGSLSITKTLQNPDDASVQATFAVTYTCTLDGQPPITGKVDVAPGTPRVINGIPTGYACSIVETAPTPVAGYTWDEATYSTQPVTVTRDGQQIGITVTNRITRDRGSLSIEKTLQNPDDASVQATFAVTYTCRMDGQPPITGTVNVAPGTPQVINGIPTGSTCTISETAPTPVAGHTWDAPTYSPPSITVNKKGETFTLGVTNRITRDRGSLAIEKTLVNPNDATVQETFAVTYTCTMQGAENVTGTVNVAPGTPEVVSGIPTGYTCTITETAPTPVTGFTWADPTYDPESIVIGIKGKTFTLGVTNTIAREMGSLVLSKTLTGGPAGYTGPFSIGYTCTFPGSEPLSGTVELAADQTSDPVDVPSGYVCSATETLPAAPAGHTFGTPQIGAPVTIANRTRSEIAVANTLTRDTGSLVVAKTLTGGPAGYTGPFPVAYSCTMAGAETITGTREVSAGGSVTIDGIPTGYSCSVTEELPTAPANHVFATPVISGAVSITKDATATVTVANRLQVIDVAIAKVVTNGAASYRPGDVIVYAITVTNTGEATVPVSAIQITDPDITGLTLVQPAPAAIAPGEWVTYTGTRVVTEAMRGQTVPNTARVTVPGDDNPNNNTATATFPVEMRVIVGQPTPLPAPARARLSIDKSGAKRAKVGDDVVYTIRVKNTSPNVATGVIVSDVIPTGMTLVGVPTSTPTQARVNTLTRSLAAARLAARRATGRAKVRATARVRTLTRALATARAADRAARAKGQPISATILRGIVRWNVGDMKPGQVVTFQVTMRAGGTKTVDRCNTADAIAGNADRVSDRQCTRFAQVAGARVIPKVTG